LHFIEFCERPSWSSQSFVFTLSQTKFFSFVPENYVHSSAGFYGNGVQGVFPVDNIMDVMEIDLSKKI
jgi:hypothetical protein